MEPFKQVLKFLRKAKAYQSGALFRCLPLGKASGLTLKFLARLKNRKNTLAYSGYLQVNRKKFYNNNYRYKLFPVHL
jgi:hypothetical protein